MVAQVHLPNAHKHIGIAQHAQSSSFLRAVLLSFTRAVHCTGEGLQRAGWWWWWWLVFEHMRCVHTFCTCAPLARHPLTFPLTTPTAPPAFLPLPIRTRAHSRSLARFRSTPYLSRFFSLQLLSRAPSPLHPFFLSLISFPPQRVAVARALPSPRPTAFCSRPLSFFLFPFFTLHRLTRPNA